MKKDQCKVWVISLCLCLSCFHWSVCTVCLCVKLAGCVFLTVSNSSWWSHMSQGKEGWRVRSQPLEAGFQRWEQRSMTAPEWCSYWPWRWHRHDSQVGSRQLRCIIQLMLTRTSDLIMIFTIHKWDFFCRNGKVFGAAFGASQTLTQTLT